MSMQPPPAAMPPAGPVPPPQTRDTGFPTPEDLAQIEKDTGYPQTKIMQDIQSSGAQSAEELYPAVYQNTGIDPQAAQTGGGYQSPNAMSPDDDDYAINRQVGMPPTDPSLPHAPPSLDSNPRRAMAQRAMRGDPEEMGESAGMQSGEGPAGEMAEDRSALGAMARMRAGHMAPHKMKRGSRPGIPMRRGY